MQSIEVKGVAYAPVMTDFDPSARVTLTDSRFQYGDPMFSGSSCTAGGTGGQRGGEGGCMMNDTKEVR